MWKFIRWRYEPLGWFGKCLFVSATSILIGMILIFFTKDQKITEEDME